MVDAGRAEQFERAGSAAALWQWTHLAAVHDTVAGTVSLYVNGILQGSVAAPPAPGRATASCRSAGLSTAASM
ncbi:LamG-like jellyroll fold domain-containing protein [Streptomyces celluloflavus]|uniref:LamG-like jellyroll fold domain-containing protein n=1 Tax=Streptomyces celluloflavus TaxID=58344 RepID=UPI0036534CBB